MFVKADQIVVLGVLDLFCLNKEALSYAQFKQRKEKYIILSAPKHPKDIISIF